MTKKELILKISKETGLSVKKSQTAVVSILSNIIKAVKSDQRINFTGFGTFKKLISNPKTCIKSETNKKIKIEKKVDVRFKAGKNFRERL